MQLTSKLEGRSAKCLDIFPLSTDSESNVAERAGCRDSRKNSLEKLRNKHCTWTVVATVSLNSY